MEGLEFVFAWSVEEIQLEDMMPMVRPIRTKVILRSGDWVRYRKRGTIYRMDLAQIVDVSRGGTTLIIKMVPRIDYTAGLISNTGNPNSAILTNTSRGVGGGIRPDQKLFRQQEVVIHHGLDALHRNISGMVVQKFFGQENQTYVPKLPNGDDMSLILFNGQVCPSIKNLCIFCPLFINYINIFIYETTNYSTTLQMDSS